jgi:hypothetical protein
MHPHRKTSVRSERIKALWVELSARYKVLADESRVEAGGAGWRRRSRRRGSKPKSP